jgi:hypothetical protein
MSETLDLFGDWLDAEAWAGFVASRKILKKPMTPRAEKIIRQKLLDMKLRGLDPNQALDNSVEWGWAGVFDPKPQERKANGVVLSFRERDAALVRADAARWGGGRAAEKPSAEIIDMEPTHGRLDHD